jgi:hypothetical protein
MFTQNLTPPAADFLLPGFQDKVSIKTPYDRTSFQKTMFLGTSWQFWTKMWQTQPKSCVTDGAVEALSQGD